MPVNPARGRRFTFVVCGTAAVVVLAAGMASWPAIVERWMIHRLLEARSFEEGQVPLAWVRDHGRLHSLLSLLAAQREDCSWTHEWLRKFTDERDEDSNGYELIPRLLKPIEAENIPELALALHGIKCWENAQLIATTLLELEPRQPDAIEALQRWLPKVATSAVSSCVLLLIEHGADPSEGLAAQVRRTEAPDSRNDLLAIVRVVGPRARGAVPAVREVLRQPTPHADFAPHDGLLFLTEVGERTSEDVYLAVNALRTWGLHSWHEPQLIEWLGPSGIEFLLELIDKPHTFIEFTSAWAALRAMGPRARPAMPTILKILLDEDCVACEEAAQALERIGPPPAELIPAFTERLASRDAAIRSAALRPLALLGPEAKAALPQIEKLLEDPEVHIQLWARAAAACIDPSRADAAVAELVKRLSSDDVLEIDTAIGALGLLGPQAKKAVPRLLELAIGSPESGVDGRARDALERIGVEDLLPFVTALRQEAEPAHRRHAADFLRRGERVPAEVIEFLHAELRSSGDEARVLTALEIAGMLGAHGEPLLPDMDAMLPESFRSIDPDPIVEARGAILRAINAKR